jgi:hypothetical protein
MYCSGDVLVWNWYFSSEAVGKVTYGSGKDCFEVKKSVLLSAKVSLESEQEYFPSLNHFLW